MHLVSSTFNLIKKQLDKMQFNYTQIESLYHD